MFLEPLEEAIKIGEGGADEYLASTEAFPTTSAEFTHKLGQYASTLQWNKLEELWKEHHQKEDAKEFEPELAAYEYALRALSESFGKSMQAEELLAYMEHVKMKPSAQAYTYVAVANSKDGHPQRVKEIFELIKTQRLHLTPFLIRKLMRAVSTTGQTSAQFIADFQPLIDRLRVNASKGDKPSKHSIQDRLDSVEMEMHGYALARAVALFDTDSANREANLILQSKAALLSTTVVHVARWYMKNKQLKEARDFVNRVLTRHRQMDETQDAILTGRLSVLLLELSMESSTPTALQTALPQFFALSATLPAPGVAAMVQFMLDALLRHRMFKQFFEVADYAERTLSSVVSLTTIFNKKMLAYVHMNQPAEALKLLSRMQSDKLHPTNRQTSTVLVLMAARLHGASDARELLLGILDQVDTPHRAAFMAVIQALCVEDKVEKALELIESMKKAKLSVSWSTYSPIMDAFSRKNLLGKQFQLYSDLIIKFGPTEAPNPAMTARLIDACRVQGLLVVAEKVASYIDNYHIRLTPMLLNSLINLTYVQDKAEYKRAKRALAQASSLDQAGPRLPEKTKYRLKLEQLVELTLQNFKGGGTTPTRRAFGELALFGFALLGLTKRVMDTFQALKDSQIPLTVRTLSVLMTALVRLGKKEEANRVFQQRLALFGPTVAHFALSNSSIAALLIRLMPKEHFGQVRRIWTEFANAKREQFARRAQPAHAASACASSTPDSNENTLLDSSEISFQAPADIVMEEGSDDLTNVVTDASDETSPILHSTPQTQPAPSGYYKYFLKDEESQESLRIPQLTTALIHAFLEVADEHRSKSGPFIADILKTCRELNVPFTPFMFEQDLKSQLQLGNIDRTLELLDEMRTSHMLMPTSLFNDLLIIASDHHSKKDLFASKIAAYMQKHHGPRVAAPNLTTWNLVLFNTRSRHYYVRLHDMQKAGCTPNAETMYEMCRGMLKHQVPLDSAWNDIFYLINYMKATYDIVPDVTLLKMLAKNITHPQILAAWQQHFFALLMDILEYSSDRFAYTNHLVNILQRLIPEQQANAVLMALYKRPDKTTWIQALLIYSQSKASAPLATLSPYKIKLQPPGSRNPELTSSPNPFRPRVKQTSQEEAQKFLLEQGLITDAKAVERFYSYPHIVDY